MTEVNACTVITRNRLAHARVLANSFLKYHPGGTITALLVDDVLREVDPAEEPFRIVYPPETELDSTEFLRMAAIYTPYELGGSLKPWIIRHVLGERATPVLYLDSDILVFSSLDECVELAGDHGLVLTPHLVDPPPRPPESMEEESRLVGGVYNTGFLAVSPEASPFLDWWADQLARDCLLQPELGLWTDQRWLDLVPSYFAFYALRDPGYNVAFWNLIERGLSRDADGYRAGGKPLRFYHFATFDANRPHLANPHITLRLSEHPVAAELYCAYGRRLRRAGYVACSSIPHAFDRGADGRPITPSVRAEYRDALLAFERTGNAQEPPNPVSQPDEFAAWAKGRYRRPSPAPPPPVALSKGVNLILGTNRQRALDDLGHRLRDCLAASGVDLQVIVFEPDEAVETVFAPHHPNAAPHTTSVVCLNPIELGSFAYHVPAEFFVSRYTVGVWLDEEHPSPELRHAAGFLDEIWVTSEFAAESLARRVSTTVRKVPLPVVPTATSIDGAADQAGDRFVFLAICDLGRSVARSRFDLANPLGVIDAFTAAFAPDEGPLLLLRTLHGCEHVSDLERLLLHSDRADVRVIDAPLMPEERTALIRECNCFVSLHRLEEFGLPLAEAMAAGKPAVATGFSGNLDYMDGESALLVGYAPRPVPEGIEGYWIGETLAEPDLDEAAGLLRRVYERPDEAQAIGLRGAAKIRSRYSCEHAREAILPLTSEHLRRREPQDVNEHASPGGLERAVRYLGSGPSNPWTAPSRMGGLGGLVRGALLRLLRPYLVRREELDIALVEALAELNHRQGHLEERLGRMERDPADGKASTDG